MASNATRHTIKIMNFSKILYSILLLFATAFLSSCEVETIRAVGACSIDDWAGRYVGIETCVGPDGSPTGDTLTLTGEIVIEANNVIDFSWTDNAGDAVQFLASLDDDNFCISNNEAFPSGDVSFQISIVTERMSDGTLVQTRAFFSNGFNFQTCTTVWTKQ